MPQCVLWCCVCPVCLVPYVTAVANGKGSVSVYPSQDPVQNPCMQDLCRTHVCQPAALQSPCWCKIHVSGPFFIHVSGSNVRIHACVFFSRALAQDPCAHDTDRAFVKDPCLRTHYKIRIPGSSTGPMWVLYKVHVSASSTRSHSYSSLYRIPACGCATGLCARCIFQGPRNPVQNPCTQDFYRIHVSTLGPYGSFAGSMSWDPLQEPSTRSMPVDPIQGTRVHVSGTFTRTMSLVSCQRPCLSILCARSMLRVPGFFTTSISPDPCLRPYRTHVSGSNSRSMPVDPPRNSSLRIPYKINVSRVLCAIHDCGFSARSMPSTPCLSFLCEILVCESSILYTDICLCEPPTRSMCFSASF